jgi:hypothetical protein
MVINVADGVYVPPVAASLAYFILTSPTCLIISPYREKLEQKWTIAMNRSEVRHIRHTRLSLVRYLMKKELKIKEIWLLCLCMCGREV